ncbi:MAG: aldo/keto reductase [Rhodospirillales bacterium]|nr:aldo/keto reductase [Rhodospirillales bacterium]
MGTVQFGTAYGISNANGQISAGMVKNILKAAHDVGIVVLDTAALYGTSEIVLGETLSPTDEFRIITKTLASPLDEISTNFVKEVEDQFCSSLEKLNRPKVDGLLVHHGKDLLKPGGMKLIDLLCSLRDKGLAKKIGVSVYDGEEIDAILGIFEPDIVQLPINIFDQRLIDSGHLEKLKAHQMEIHARSIFLQGALLMPLCDLPEYFTPVASKFRGLNDLSESTGLNKLELCLSFAHQLKQLDVILVGVTSETELREIHQSVGRALQQDIDFSGLEINDPNYVNPANWKI